MLSWVRDFIFGKPEYVAYRLSHIFTYRRPFPLLKLLQSYTGEPDMEVKPNTDIYAIYRDEIHDLMTRQLQNLALTEVYHKYKERIPESTFDGLPHPNHKCEVKKSQIRGAGKGVFLEGEVRRGQIVCIYPGLSYFQVMQGTIDQYGLNLRWPRGSRDHLINVDKEIWIDANPRLNVVTKALQHNMYAKAHFVNHPSGKHIPNVIPVLCDFGPDLIELPNKRFMTELQNKRINLDTFVCNEFAWEFARLESEYIPSVVMIALRDILDGEELFYDYEWEYNINNIKFSFREDIAFDWPWYQVVPQEYIDPYIEPFLTKTAFENMCDNDNRLRIERGVRTLISPESLQTTDESQPRPFVQPLKSHVNGVTKKQLRGLGQKQIEEKKDQILSELQTMDPQLLEINESLKDKNVIESSKNTKSIESSENNVSSKNETKRVEISGMNKPFRWDKQKAKQLLEEEEKQESSSDLSLTNEESKEVSKTYENRLDKRETQRAIRIGKDKKIGVDKPLRKIYSNDPFFDTSEKRKYIINKEKKEKYEGIIDITEADKSLEADKQRAKNAEYDGRHGGYGEEDII